MRIPILTILVSVAAMVGATSVSAQGMYAAVNGGVNITHDGEIDSSGVDTAFETGYAISGAIGYDFGDYRLEGEISYRANDVDAIGGAPISANIATTALMANAFYDFDSGSPFVPYAGVGLGVGFSTFERSGADGDATELAYQFILGGAYEVSDSVEVTLDWRLFSMGTPIGTPKYDFSGFDVSQAYWNSAIMLGVRTRF
jgi:opacity protein-like surface antigen